MNGGGGDWNVMWLIKIPGFRNELSRSVLLYASFLAASTALTLSCEPSGRSSSNQLQTKMVPIFGGGLPGITSVSKLSLQQS